MKTKVLWLGGAVLIVITATWVTAWRLNSVRKGGLGLGTPGVTILPTLKAGVELPVAPDGWKSYVMEKPLGITFMTPAEYQVVAQSDNGLTWGVNVTLDDRTKLGMCVGCNPTGNKCGIYNEKCIVDTEYQPVEGVEFKRFINKSTGMLAEISGWLEKDDGEEIYISLTTVDGSMPGKETLTQITKLLQSIKSN